MAIGATSVMPRPWPTEQPSRASHSRDASAGQGAALTSTLRSDDRS
jgi:hypothetical protein